MRAAEGSAVRIAVTGAAGNVGAEVICRLAADTTHDVVAVTRRAGAVAPSAQVAPAVADYGDEDSLRRALTGVDTLVLVASDGPVARVIDHHANVIAAARSCDVEHVVALSSLDADAASPFCYAQSAAFTERLLRGSGCAWSVVRASIFAEFFVALARARVVAGRLRLPLGDGRVSLVSRVDVAGCLAALAGAAPTGRCHAVTGPEALDGHALAALLQRDTGVATTYVDGAPDAFCLREAEAGADPWWTYAFATMFESIRQSRWAAVSDEVHRLTGRAPERA